MEIEPDETVESQYQKATKFFAEALFALPGSGGDMNYFLNPGIDLAQFIKIKCSVLTGDGDQKTRKGLNPQERFEKTRTRGYAPSVARLRASISNTLKKTLRCDFF
jgi:hypothetical protein